MKKKHSPETLIAQWGVQQDPTSELPSSVIWGDGSAASINDYLEHLNDTFEWESGSPGGPRRITYPWLIATARYDEIAGRWVISGRGISRTVLDVSDPAAHEDEIAWELAGASIVYRFEVDPRPSHAVVRRLERNHASTNLYWISSIERRRDWLIFGHNMRSAAAYHRDEMHCTIDSGNCRRILQHVNPFPFYSSGDGDVPCYAANEDLEQLGFKILTSPTVQAVRLGHLKFVEGYQFDAVMEIQDDMIESKTGGRPFGTQRHPPPLLF